MANQAPPSLDLTGQVAAIYPSEETLWAVGPPINPASAGNQGMFEGEDGGTLYAPPAPNTLQEAEATEDLIHLQLNAETSNRAYDEKWVNLGIYGPAGYGAFNEQPYFSGHSQNVLSDPSAEQGWGVGPARRWAHYPVADLPNPYRNRMVHLRMGEFPWQVSDTFLYYRTQLAWEAQWQPYKYRSPVTPVVQVPASVPFVQTVPTYGGGPSPVPGMDIPGLIADAIYG